MAAFNSWQEDPEDTSVIRPSDASIGFGESSPYGDLQLLESSYTSRARDLNEQQNRAENNAMEMLRASMQKSADVSPTQAFATALLAAIPTIGGYAIGKSVGAPELPAGYAEAGGKMSDIPGFAKAQAPEFSGGLQGLEAGAGAAGGYLKGLDANQAQANDVRTKMAQAELNRAGRLETQVNQLTNAELNRQAEIDMIPLREASQMRLQNNSAQNTMERQLELDRIKSERDRISPDILAKIDRGEPLSEQDYAGKNPEQVRAITAAREANRRQVQQDFKKKQSAIPGYSNYSNAELSPSTAARISQANEGISKTKQLLDVYLSNPDDFTGDASQIQLAVSGMFTNAQRMATNSGASFSTMEKGLIDAASVASKAGNLQGWLKAQLLGRNQQVFAQTLKGLYEKTQDYAIAEAYGHLRNDVDLSYYPTPILQKWDLAPKGNSKLAEVDAKIAEIEAQLQGAQ